MSLAHDTAHLLATHGRTDSDALTTADIDTAADLAGHPRPTDEQRHDVRAALDHING